MRIKGTVWFSTVYLLRLGVCLLVAIRARWGGGGAEPQSMACLASK